MGRKKTRTGMSDERFVTAWNESATLSLAAGRTGQTKNGAKFRASKLRSAGHELKHFRAGQAPPKRANPNSPSYEPTAAEIQAACESIQRGSGPDSYYRAYLSNRDQHRKQMARARRDYSNEH